MLIRSISSFRNFNFDFFRRFISAGFFDLFSIYRNLVISRSEDCYRVAMSHFVIYDDSHYHALQLNWNS